MTPAGGRRSATRGVFVEEPELLLPDPIALDTSFVVEALIATQPLHVACRAFLARIVESGVSVTTSDLLPVELAEAVFAIALKERWGSRWRGHRTDGRARRRAGRLLNDTISRWETLLAPIDHFRVPLSDTASAARSLMTGYGLASHDAIHAASAIAADAYAIVTIDTGFALLPPSLLTVSTDRSRLVSCRSKRPRSSRRQVLVKSWAHVADAERSDAGRPQADSPALGWGGLCKKARAARRSRGRNSPSGRWWHHDAPGIPLRDSSDTTGAQTL